MDPIDVAINECCQREKDSLKARITEMELAIREAYKMLPHPSPAGEVLYLVINPEN